MANNYNYSPQQGYGAPGAGYPSRQAYGTDPSSYNGYNPSMYGQGSSGAGAPPSHPSSGYPPYSSYGQPAAGPPPPPGGGPYASQPGPPPPSYHHGPPHHAQPPFQPGGPPPQHMPPVLSRHMPYAPSDPNTSPAYFGAPDAAPSPSQYYGSHHHHPQAPQHAPHQGYAPYALPYVPRTPSSAFPVGTREWLDAARAEATAAFYEADRDGSGYLDVQEFYNMIRKLVGSLVSYQEALTYFANTDADRNGRIGFSEFEKLYIGEIARRRH